MLRERTATAIFCSLAMLTYLATSAPAVHAAANTGGAIEGYVSCRNDKALTGVRIQAHTPIPGQREGVDEAADAAIKHRSKSIGTYSASMTTIRGDYQRQGSHVFVYIYCDNQPAGGVEQYLYGPNTTKWTINMFNCDEGNCRA
jgi:hypothetical protein